MIELSDRIVSVGESWHFPTELPYVRSIGWKRNVALFPTEFPTEFSIGNFSDRFSTKISIGKFGIYQGHYFDYVLFIPAKKIRSPLYRADFPLSLSPLLFAVAVRRSPSPSAGHRRRSPFVA